MSEFNNNISSEQNNKVNRRTLKNTLYWLVMSILILVILYNLYNRYFGSAPVKKVPGQQTENYSENTTEDNEAKDDATKNGKTQEDGTNEEKVEAPDFELKDLNGNKVKLSDFKGKTVFLNFWALWCPFCIEEMPDLNSANEKFLKEEEAIILTVNGGDSLDKVKKYMEDNKFSLPVLLDTDKSISMLYGASSIPLTYIIDKEGYLYAYIPGKTNEKTLFSVLEEMKKN